ncbi:hypothetical protein yc1106_02751 [Curvularia clavata]|uniref:FHA domain-containing protein n=1 Tax=Curvularia clavata TaxID=95742 RepID=A0A9Q8Z3C5_CURCL|nr:hypothetical protein yc1106_02751 [Curvularia clavata]
MRYVRLSTECTKDGKVISKSRLVRFTFGAVAGRHCLSFGTSRSSDYILPSSEGVAPHHFILFINDHDPHLQLRSTCSQGLYVMSHFQEDVQVVAPNDTLKVPTPMTIRIGKEPGIKFKILLPNTTSEYHACLSAYRLTIQPPVAPSDRKRRQSSAAISGGHHKRRQDAPVVESSSPRAPFERPRPTISWFLRISHYFWNT